MRAYTEEMEAARARVCAARERYKGDISGGRSRPDLAPRIACHTDHISSSAQPQWILHAMPHLAIENPMTRTNRHIAANKTAEKTDVRIPIAMERHIVFDILQQPIHDFSRRVPSGEGSDRPDPPDTECERRARSGESGAAALLTAQLLVGSPRCARAVRGVSPCRVPS